jgi:hypothetical protein
MTAATIDLTETQTIKALGDFLTTVLPAGTAVVRGQVNRVPEVKGPDFVVMTPILRERLATNTDTYSDGFDTNGPQIKDAMQPARVTVQLDIHGPDSADNAQVITTLLRDEYAVNIFATFGLDVTPLYAGDPRQSPFLNGEQQIETRWTVDSVLQCNPIVTVPQDFASTLSVGLVNVDAAYPPT